MTFSGRASKILPVTTAETRPYPTQWLSWSVWGIGAVFYLVRVLPARRARRDDR